MIDMVQHKVVNRVVKYIYTVLNPERLRPIIPSWFLKTLITTLECTSKDIDQLYSTLAYNAKIVANLCMKSDDHYIV